MRRGLRIALLILVALIAAMAALAWVGSRPWALQRAADAIIHLTQGKVDIKGARGSLYGPLHIDALTVTTDTQSIDIAQIDLDWRPMELLWGRLSISRLDLGSLTARQTHAGSKPASLPRTLRLPVGVSIDAATVGELNIVHGSNHTTLSHLAASAQTSFGGDYHLELKNLDSPWGSMLGTLNLGAARPFPLDARLTAWQGTHYRVEAQAGGSLEKLELKAHGVQGIAFDLSGQLAPFTTLPLQQLDLQARNIDPKQLRPGLPQADISADLKFAQSSAQQVRGSLHLSNASAGPVDHGQIPIAQVDAKVDGRIDHLVFSNLLIDLGQGGQLTGNGELERGTFTSILTTQNLNPHAIHTRIRPFRLAGQIKARTDAASQSLQASLGQANYKLDVDLDRQGDLLNIRTAQLSAGKSRIDAHGQIALSGDHAFKLQGKLERFNPAAFGSYPIANLNAQLASDGALSPLAGSLSYDLSGSRYRNQPVSGKGKIALTASRHLDGDATLAIGNNRFQVKGRFGEPRDRLFFNLDAPQLAVIDSRLTGQVNASGVLHGSFDQPAGTLNIEAGKLHWDDQFTLEQLHASGQLDHGLDGPFNLVASLQGFKYEKEVIDQAHLDIHGKRSAHEIKLAMQNGQFDLDALLSGKLSGNTWSGKINQLENRGDYAFRLEGPASLAVGKQSQQLDNANFNFLNGQIQLVSFARKNGTIESNGRIVDLPIIPLLDLFQVRQGFDGDLQISGNWTLQMGSHPQVHLNLFRERGDLIARTDPKLPLGLTQLALLLQLKDEQLKADASVAGSQLGRARISLQTRISRRGDKWGLAADTPVSGEANVNLPSLAWLSSLLDRTGGLKLDGALRGRTSVAGSISRPELHGEIRGERLALNWAEAGLHLNGGLLNASLEKDALILNSLNINGPTGSFSAQGSARLADGKTQVDITGKASKLEVISRPDAKLTISGSSRLALDNSHLVLQGDISADRARITLPETRQATHSDDVVVIGRAAPQDSAQPTKIQIDMQLDLGNDFKLQGRGLDAQLTGKLKVQAASLAHPQVFGTVKVASGTYEAYGQKLTIERGILDFRGRLDNPVLDIVAMRTNQDVEAGVSLSGTALAPRARLVSSPDVPDSDKLSWLVLGHSMDTASGADYGLLTAAAGALLSTSQSASLETRIAHAAGLDEISLKGNPGSGGLESTVLSLGKRLSKNAYVSYEQGLGGISYLLKLNYTLSKRLSVQAQTGQESAVDLLYTFTFD